MTSCSVCNNCICFCEVAKMNQPTDLSPAQVQTFNQCCDLKSPELMQLIMGHLCEKNSNLMRHYNKFLADVNQIKCDLFREELNSKLLNHTKSSCKMVPVCGKFLELEEKLTCIISTYTKDVYDYNSQISNYLGSCYRGFTFFRREWEEAFNTNTPFHQSKIVSSNSFALEHVALAFKNELTKSNFAPRLERNHSALGTMLSLDCNTTNDMPFIVCTPKH